MYHHDQGRQRHYEAHAELYSRLNLHYMATGSKKDMLIDVAVRESVLYQ